MPALASHSGGGGPSYSEKEETGREVTLVTRWNCWGKKGHASGRDGRGTLHALL